MDEPFVAELKRMDQQNAKRAPSFFIRDLNVQHQLLLIIEQERIRCRVDITYVGGQAAVFIIGSMVLCRNG